MAPVGGGWGFKGLCSPEAGDIMRWKGTRRDHWVQLLAPHKNTQKSNCMAESIVQMFLKLQQAWFHDYISGEPVPAGDHPVSEE